MSHPIPQRAPGDPQLTTVFGFLGAGRWQVWPKPDYPVCETWEEVASHSARELRRIPGIGPKSIARIIDALDGLGITHTIRWG